jgi:hypothetical protein
MKHSLVLSTAVMTCILATGNAVAQASGEGTKGPKQVVEEFLAMETNGGRLTPEGWRQADAFFARPAPEPSRRHIVVISPNYSVYETWTKGDQAQVYNDCEGPGQIDTALRYTPPESGVLKTTGVYRLVRTQEGVSPTSTIRSTEWKIEEPPTFLWLNKETAVRYVAEMRDKTSGPLVKKNADRTLAVLRRHHGITPGAT